MSFGHWKGDRVADDETSRHDYLSTACHHGRHDYCSAMVGVQGEKRPARCKFCDARCVCPCHADDATGGDWPGYGVAEGTFR